MNYNVAIIGASGAVGKKILATLIDRKFPIRKITLLASERSAGKKISYDQKEYEINVLDEFDFSDIDFAFFSAGASVSAKFALIAESKGCYVIDNTSHFRMMNDISLIVPEVNAEEINHLKRRIISNPNCSTIQMLVAVEPIHKINNIKKIIVSSYQSVSGAGQNAINELTKQSQDLLKNEKIEISSFPKQIAFNVIPQIDVFTDNKYTKEEMKMVNETKKILDKNISVNATCVRVPTFVGHAESLYLELEKNSEVKIIEKQLKDAKGVKYSNFEYHTPLDSAEKNWVYISRLRKDLEKENAFNLWVVSDNLLKGAALNSVQIAETIITKKLI